MTMPHLQNCPHVPDGWCLTCVGELHQQLDLEKRKNTVLLPTGTTPTEPGEYEAILRYRIASDGSKSSFTGEVWLWLQNWTNECGWMDLDIVGNVLDGVTSPDKILRRHPDAIWRRVAEPTP